MKFSTCIISNKIDDVFIRCIQSFLDCSDEICIGVNDVPDNALEKLGKQFPTLKIYPINWKGYSNTKNELVDLATNDWILSIDSDEVADPFLQKKLKAINATSNEIIYSIRRKNFLHNKEVKFGTWGRSNRFVNRFYNKKHTQWNANDVHEDLDISQSQIIPLDGALHHFTANSIQEIIAKNNHYASLSAAQLFAKKKRAGFVKLYLSPAFTFIKQFVFQLGFLDGRVGYQIAKANANYTYKKYHLLKQMYR